LLFQQFAHNIALLSPGTELLNALSKSAEIITQVCLGSLTVRRKALEVL
jgi:hypothetical protein